METPVALLVFNRPHTTQKLFKAIRQAKPKKLFIIADGPRKDKPKESLLCEETRAIFSQIDWKCEVYKRYSDVNIGLKENVSSGINWVFENTEKAIILEDDCLPTPDFFKFCEENLDRYQHDKRIMMICGTNLLGEWKPNCQSYHFSYHQHCWGWATWKRAWSYYDSEMSLWKKECFQNQLKHLVGNHQRYLSYKNRFDNVYTNKVSSWAIRWHYSCLTQSGMSIIPAVNLITNIGFGEDATNTQSKDLRAFLPTRKMQFPLQLPETVIRDIDYEDKIFTRHGTRRRKKISRLFKRIFEKK